MTPHEELMAHERLCAERYATIHKRLDRIESMITKLIWTILVALIGTLLAVVSSAKAEARTIIEQRGMPVPTAIAPSISAYSQDSVSYTHLTLPTKRIV